MAKMTKSVLSGICGLAARHDALERNPVRDTGGIETAARKAAVGLIVAPEQADQVLLDQTAYAVMPIRELLRDPHWPWTAASALGDQVPWPPR